MRSGLTQAQVAERAGVSQNWVSMMERGLATAASLETWAAVAAAVGEQLSAFLEHAPGADRPHDYQHLLRQRLVLEVAEPGGWQALPEAAIDADRDRSRSVDVLLMRAARREAAVVECSDFVDDVGGQVRGLDGKVTTVERHMTLGRDVSAGAGWKVRGLWVVRGTRRNRALVSEFRSIFAAKFPASSSAWLEALANPERPIPDGLGFLWTDVAGTRLIASRL